jgi:hypothetical protein
MNELFCPAVELLEMRIAPAGLVTTTFLNGLLTIDGGDGSDHDVSVVKTGANTFRVTGNDTGINTVGVASKNYQGVLTGVLFEGGAGADIFAVSNLSPLKTFTFHGNEGVDSLRTANLVTAAAGRVDITLGTESGSVNFFGSRTTVHGPLNIDLGGGGTAGLRSVTTTVDGNVTIVGGDGSDVLEISGNATLFRHKLTFTGGGGDDSFTSGGTSLTVLGAVAMDGGEGSNHFTFASNHHSFGTALTAGLVDVKLGVGPGDVTFLGKSTNILGKLKIDLGAGGGTATLDSGVTGVRNSVAVTGGEGDDMVNFHSRTSIGGALSFVGDGGMDHFKATGGLLSVKGATTVDGGVGASAFEVNVASLALAKLSVAGGTVEDTVSIIANGIIAGDANLQLGTDGTGGSSTTLQSRAGLANGLKFGGTLTINMVGPTVDFLTIANIQVAGAFVAQTGEDVSTVAISKLNVLNDLTLMTGEGADVVNLDHVKALDFQFDGGVGADVVNLDNFRVREFAVDTGMGADELRIERNATFLGTSQVQGNATIATGIGADQIRIGNSSDHANLMVLFKGTMLLDAGDGPNMRNDVLGSNFFETIPQIIATGGTLTQTEAV